MEGVYSMAWIITLIPISLILVSLAKRLPNTIESLYSIGVYRILSQPLSKLTGIFPFSLGEFLFYGFVVWIGFMIFTIIKALITYDKKLILNAIKRTAIVLSILLFSFVSLWGLNYYRLPLSKTMNLNTMNYSKEDLEELCVYLIHKANSYRNDVREDSRGVMKLSQGKRNALFKAYSGYESLSREYPIFRGDYGKAKIVITSRFMSYAGIAGIFFPFTIEANVNGDVPDAVFPSNTAHEMAHQRGYAREDEANFISFLACISNDDIEYKYSGTLLALIHSINALYRADSESAAKLVTQYSPGVKRDLADINAYWDKFEGPVERASTKINNTYLKANNQKDGVQSYGRMVDLLLAYYKSKILD